LYSDRFDHQKTVWQTWIKLPCTHSYRFKFDDTKRIIRGCKSKDRHCNGHGTSESQEVLALPGHLY
jgi:hypothetical protein